MPQKDRARRTEHRRPRDFALIPEAHNLRGITITTLLDYRDSNVSDLIRSLKYEHSTHAAEIAAEILADYLREEIASIKTFSPRPVILVPMPLHTSRLHERGFNQVEKVLRHLPTNFRDGSISTVSKKLIERTLNTAQQAKLSREERLNNVRGVFRVSDRHTVAYAHVILIDDVTTTGATLTECARTLEEAGAKITLLALARA